MIRLSPLFLLSMIWLLFLLTGCDSGSVQISTCLSDKDCSFGQTCEKGQCVGDAADDDDDVFNPGDGDNDATEDDDDDTEDGDSSSDDDDDDDDNLDGDDSDGDTSDGDDDPGLACEQSGGQCVLDLPCASGSHLSVDTLGCDTTANPYCCLPNIPACVQNGGQCIELGNPCPNSWVSLDSNAGCDGICCMPDPTRSCAENGGACVPPTPQSTCPAGTVSVQSECEGQTICCAELETACSNQGGYCQATNFPPNCDQNDYEPSPNALGCANGQMCCLPEDTRCYTDDDCGDPTCRDLQANSCAQSNPICDRDTGYCGVDEDFYQSARCYDDGMCHQSQLCNEDDETWVECDGQNVQECWCTENGQLECDPNPCGDEETDCIGDLGGICASTWFGTSCPDGYSRNEAATCNSDGTQCCVLSQSTQPNACEQGGGYCIQPWGWSCREGFHDADTNGCPEMGWGQYYQCCLPN